MRVGHIRDSSNSTGLPNIHLSPINWLAFSDCFKYADSYAKGMDDKYTIYDSDENDKYFYDSYSKTNAMEDRARVFENMLAPKKKDCTINEYPRLKAKAQYIKERICKLYPSLKDTDIFMNLDD